MRGRGFATGVVAALGVLAWTGLARAGDTIRLNRVDDTPTQTLVDNGQGADTIRTWHHGWGGWGGYRGFGWGGYRGFGWGGYRGFGWGGYYRPYYGFGWGGLYRPWGYGLGWGGLGYGLGYGGLGYGLGWGGLYGIGYGGGYSPYYGLGYGGFFPCSGSTATVYSLSIPVATLGTTVAPTLPQAPADATMPAVPNGNGTYPYNGGPKEVLPNPGAAPAPSISTPQRTVPLEGRSVSLPKASSKWNYPAYGETAKRVVPAQERTYLTRGEPKKTNAH